MEEPTTENPGNLTGAAFPSLENYGKRHLGTKVPPFFGA